MGIQEELDSDPNKGWQLYFSNIHRAVVDDVEGFSDGLVYGEQIAENTSGRTDTSVLQEAIREIPEDKFGAAFVLGAIQGVFVKRADYSS